MLALAVLTYISYKTDSYPWFLGISIGYFCFWFAYRTFVVDLKAVGDPSYGIYLWGWPTQQVAVSMFPTMTPGTNFLVGILGAGMMGLLSWFLIERPALSLKKPAGRFIQRLKTRFASTSGASE